MEIDGGDLPNREFLSDKVPPFSYVLCRQSQSISHLINGNFKHLKFGRDLNFFFSDDFEIGVTKDANDETTMLDMLAISLASK